MDYGNKLTAIESMVTQYALAQMQANNIPPELALLIMKGVYSQFQEVYINNLVLSMVQEKEPDSGTGNEETKEDSE